MFKTTLILCLVAAFLVEGMQGAPANSKPAAGGAVVVKQGGPAPAFAAKPGAALDSKPLQGQGAAKVLQKS